MFGSPYSDSANSSESSFSDNFGTENLKGKMFIGGLSPHTSSAALGKYFTQFGELSDYTVKCDARTGMSRNFGFIVFANPVKVGRVLAIKDHYLDGKKIDPQLAIQNIGSIRSVHCTQKKLFIGGVPPKMTSEDLKCYFSLRYGSVEDVVLKMLYPEQKHRGFGFITFFDDAIAKKVCDEHYHWINGHKIETKQAKDKKMLKPSPEVEKRPDASDLFKQFSFASMKNNSGYDLNASDLSNQLSFASMENNNGYDLKTVLSSLDLLKKLCEKGPDAIESNAVAMQEPSQQPREYRTPIIETKLRKRLTAKYMDCTVPQAVSSQTTASIY